MRKSFPLFLAFAVLLWIGAGPASAGDKISLLVMATDDAAKEAARYEVLRKYVKIADTALDQIQIQVAPDFPTAAQMFVSGQVEGMFAGSFVAATLIAKGLAVPVVRPVLADGTTGYYTIVLARKGTKPFEGIGDLKGKRVAYTLLASAGEVYVRSLLPAFTKPESFFTPVPAASHFLAVQAADKGEADYAFVKDLAFDAAKFPNLAVVGKETTLHPNMTLILTPKAMERFGKDIKSRLIELEKDLTLPGNEMRKAFNCKGFTPTERKDFDHTFMLMKSANIDPKTFEWKF